MKKLIYILTISMIVLSGCAKKLEELSKNPNDIKNGSPQTLMSQTIYNIVVTKIRAAKGVGHELMGYTVAKNERAYVQRFDIRPDQGNDIWNRHYIALQNLKDLHNLAVMRGEVNYEAVAIILKAIVMSDLTDTFGNVPYSEATQGDELNFLSKFDNAVDIYRDLLANLDRAALLLDNRSAMDSGSDLLYGHLSGANQVNAWKKLCNSLRLRLYLRVSKDSSFDSANKIATIFNNSSVYPYFTAAADIAQLNFTNELPFYNPYWNATNGNFGNGVAPSNAILGLLSAPVQDIRLNTYYNRSMLVWVGMPQGFPLGEGTQYYVDGTSTLNNNLKTSPKLGILMGLDEVKFIQAEAQLKGWITLSATPLTLLQDGIRESAVYWTGNPQSAAYITSVNNEFNAATTTEAKLEVLIKHKYLASFFKGLDAWFEYNRTGYPTLAVDPGASNSGNIPKRLLYPVVTQRYNPTNYQAAVNIMGSDDINYKLFWHK